MSDSILKNLDDQLSAVPDTHHYGRVTAVSGMLVEVAGLSGKMNIGDQCELIADNRDPLRCEAVGFKQDTALLLPLGKLDGIGLQCKARITHETASVAPHESWLGRVIDAHGNPLDQAGPLADGDRTIPLRNSPPSAHKRTRLGKKLDLGVRAVNTMLPVCRGQRMGIFAGSGVGKSVLMSMMAKHTTADISVIGLIGERGREVQEFLEDTLGEAGLKRAVVVVATSDEPPLVRRQAAYTTLAVAEYFRDMGRDVLCMMDSVTRFAMAQREIGLAAGEPPATKGYPPTTFSELAQLLERAGPGTQDTGSITGIFSVLVEGDDHNEPVSDAVRGIIDGHIVLDREIAMRGRYPAIDVLRSVSRSMPGCLNDEQNELVSQARKILSTYEDMSELIRLGAYKKGSDPKVDRAIDYIDDLENFLAQKPEERASVDDGFDHLAAALDMNDSTNDVEPGENDGEA